MNLREKFFSTTLREELVNIPEIGDVLVREMTTAEVEGLAKKHGSGQSAAFSSLPETVILCAMDPETKQPIWTAADRDALKKLPPRMLLPIVKAVGGMSSNSDKAVEAAEKNLLAGAASSSNWDGSSDALSANSPSD